MIKKGLVIKISVHYSVKDNNNLSYIGIWYVDKSRDINEQHKKIADMELSKYKINFGNGEIHKIKIEYNVNETIRI